MKVDGQWKICSFVYNFNEAIPEEAVKLMKTCNPDASPASKSAKPISARKAANKAQKT